MHSYASKPSKFSACSEPNIHGASEILLNVSPQFRFWGRYPRPTPYPRLTPPYPRPTPPWGTGGSDTWGMKVKLRGISQTSTLCVGPLPALHDSVHGVGAIHVE